MQNESKPEGCSGLQDNSGSRRARSELMRMGPGGVLMLALLVMVWVAAILASCGGGGGGGGGLQPPPDVTAVHQTAINNWNRFYGTNVRAQSMAAVDTIKSATQRSQIVDEITDPTLAWLPTGDLAHPALVNARRVADDPTLTPQDIAAWKAKINAVIKVGQHIRRTTWRKGAVTFTTLTITDDKTIIYDDMFSNVFLTIEQLRLVSRDVVTFPTTCLDERFYWLWGSERGFVRAVNSPTCGSGGLVSCDKECTAFMVLGEAQILCKASAIPGKDCCQLEWKWGVATGFKKVKVKVKEFEIEIEGIIGQSAQGEGSCTNCCPTPTPTPAPTPTPGTGSAGGTP